MPNRNYIRGRALEYQVKANYEDLGWVVIRAAGSHGPFDIIAFHPDGRVHLIQCKAIKDTSKLKQLKKSFEKTLPFKQLHPVFVQILAYKITGFKEYISYIPGESFNGD